MNKYWRKTLWTTVFIGLAYVLFTFLWLGPETTRRATDFFFTVGVLNLVTLAITFIIYKVDTNYIYASLPKQLSACSVSVILSTRYLLALRHSPTFFEDFLLMNILVAVCLLLGIWLAVAIYRGVLKRRGLLGPKRDSERWRTWQTVTATMVQMTFILFFFFQFLALWWLPNIFFPGF